MFDNIKHVDSFSGKVVVVTRFTYTPFEDEVYCNFSTTSGRHEHEYCTVDIGDSMGVYYGSYIELGWYYEVGNV